MSDQYQIPGWAAGQVAHRRALPVYDRMGHLVGYQDIAGRPVDAQGNLLGQGNLTTSADAAAHRPTVATGPAHNGPPPGANPTATVNTPYTRSTPPNPYHTDVLINGKQGTPQWDAGNVLLGTLSLPPGLQADSTFAFAITNNDPTQDLPKGTGPRAYYANSHQQLTEMTMAGAMSWLRTLAATDTNRYNEIVYQLVAAQYLTPSQARYASPNGAGGYTTAVGNAFLKSAADVWSINGDPGVGRLITWGDHIQSLIDGGIASGQIDANGMPTSGSGGGGAVRTPPTRTDQWADPKTVKANANSAAHSILGRDLNAAEQSAFDSLFHSAEQQWNNETYGAQMAAFNGQASQVHNQPSTSAAALDYVKTDPALAGERTQQMLGSYLGVLRQMVGLGGGGIASAIA